MLADVVAIIGELLPLLQLKSFAHFVQIFEQILLTRIAAYHCFEFVGQ